MNRRTFSVVVFLAWIALLGFWLAADARSQAEAAPTGSIFDTSEAGTSLFNEYLVRRLGRGHVDLLDGDLPATRPSTTVMFRIMTGDARPIERTEYRPAPDEPDDPTENREHENGASSDEVEDDEDCADQTESEEDSDECEETALPLLSSLEEEWIRAGGTMVMSPGCALRNECVEPVDASSSTRVFPIWNQVNQIEPPQPAIFSPGEIEHCHSIINYGAGSLICRERIGSGELIRIATPEILLNSSIGIADHLDLVEATIAGKDRVVIDGRPHGFGSSPGLVHLLIEDWRLGVTMTLGLIAFFLWMSRGKSSIGPRSRPDQFERSEAIDLVESLGTLFDRAVSDDEAISLYQQTLAREEARLRKRGRIPANEPEAVPSASGLQASLESLNNQFRRILDADRR